MNKKLENLILVSDILQEYVEIHDQIFKPSFRKSIHIPGIFKQIDFGTHFTDLDALSNELREITVSNEEENKHIVFQEYVTALLNAIEKLRFLCKNLLAKSKGDSYSMEEYKSDVASYQDLVAEYRAIGSKLNLQLANAGIQGGRARPAKTRGLINHFIHIIIGILFPATFMWTKSGILVTVLLSAVIQGIDQFRIYRHYQNEFQLIDKIHGVKEDRSAAFELDTIFRHGQVFIFKIIWYGLVTMVAAGFRR